MLPVVHMPVTMWWVSNEVAAAHHCQPPAKTTPGTQTKHLTWDTSSTFPAGPSLRGTPVPPEQYVFFPLRNEVQRCGVASQCCRWQPLSTSHCCPSVTCPMCPTSLNTHQPPCWGSDKLQGRMMGVQFPQAKETFPGCSSFTERGFASASMWRDSLLCSACLLTEALTL